MKCATEKIWDVCTLDGDTAPACHAGKRGRDRAWWIRAAEGGLQLRPDASLSASLASAHLRWLLRSLGLFIRGC
jgi:hypothetical protein